MNTEPSWQRQFKPVTPLLLVLEGSECGGHRFILTRYDAALSVSTTGAAASETTAEMKLLRGFLDPKGACSRL